MAIGSTFRYVLVNTDGYELNTLYVVQAGGMCSGHRITLSIEGVYSEESN